MNARRNCFALQVEEAALQRVERVRVHALLAQRGEHGLAGDERDLPARPTDRP